MLDVDRFKEKKNRRELHELTRIQKAPAKICAIGNGENQQSILSLGRMCLNLLFARTK